MFYYYTEINHILITTLINLDIFKNGRISFPIKDPYKLLKGIRDVYILKINV